MYEAEIHLWPDWHIIREIGRGSFGRVYEIHRQNGEYLEKAALKIIRVPENPADVEQLRMDGVNKEDTESYLRRYVEEIRSEIGLMQRFVGYSNIVSYEDYLIQKLDNAIGWYILIRMELLTPLQDYMSSKTLSEQEVIRIGLDISQALIICHGEGIIHRDIKPQNIFVNERGFFKLGDFGISRTVPGSGSVLSFKGTVSYMAPETFSMQGTDERSDIYSLALVLYRLLNGGREPFLTSSKFTPVEKENAQRRRMAGETLPVPERGSSALCGILAVALAADPAVRYQTAAEFHAALQRIANVKQLEAVEVLPGSMTLDLHALGQRGISAADRPVQQVGNPAQFQHTAPSAVRLNSRAGGSFDRNIGQGGNWTQEQERGKTLTAFDWNNIGGGYSGSNQRRKGTERRNYLLMGLLGGLVLVFSISLLALFIPLLSKKTGENREDTAARQDIEQGAVEQVAAAGEVSGQNNKVQESDQQNLQAQSAQENRQGSQTVTGSDQGSAESNGAAADAGGSVSQNLFMEKNDLTDAGGGTVISGNPEGSVYPPMEVVEYTIYCQDEDGEILQVSSGTGIKGREIEVDAPDVSGYTAAEPSESMYLTGDEDYVTFVYEKKGNIPASAIRYNGHSYYACVSSENDSFWDAAAYCESLGGYMAVINTEEENRTLYDYVFDQMGYKSAYFGYTDDGSDQGWYWIGADDSSYENWKEGQPDNLKHGDRTEHYALFFHRDTRYKWNDGDFGPDSSGNVIFLIEWDW